MAPLFTASQPWRSIISLWGTGREKSNNGRVPCPHLSLELFGNSSWNKLWGKEDQCKFYFEPKFWSLGKDGELKERIVKGGREGWVFFLINPFVSQYWDLLSTGSMEFSKRFMVAILNELMACWTFGEGELQTVNGSFSIPRFIFHSFNLISHYSLLQFRWFLTCYMYRTCYYDETKNLSSRNMILKRNNLLHTRFVDLRKGCYHHNRPLWRFESTRL